MQKITIRKKYTVGELVANPIWRPHRDTVFKFRNYLVRTAGLKFTAHGEAQTSDGPQEVTTILDYVHRWTPNYKNMILAKFYQLENWLKENPGPVTMITLTTYQGGTHSIEEKGEIVTIPESFNLLKEGFFNLSRKLRKIYPDNNYAWIMEPHKTGYPHIHIAYFGTVKEADQLRLKNLWQLWGIGSREHGLDFKEKTSENSVKSIRNYLMKYMIKSFTPTDDNSFWTTGETVFNALAWKNSWRLFGTTKELTRVMKRHDTPSENITTYIKVELIDQDGKKRTTWTRPDPDKPCIAIRKRKSRK